MPHGLQKVNQYYLTMPEVGADLVDCRICNRRRIRCDRSLPSCKKCDIRSIDCPGYDLKLKWDQGVASRGKLARKAIPVIGCDPPIQQDASGLVIEVSAESTGSPKEKSQALTNTSYSRPLDQTRYDARQWSESVLVMEDISLKSVSAHNAYKMDLSLSWDALPVVLQNAEARRLMHHYHQYVAATLVWIDDSDNPWRKYILPLAMRSPALMFSILALAAEHLSKHAIVSEQGTTQSSMITNPYRDQGLKLLAQQLKQELQAESSIPSDTTKSMLATMLVFCQLEMIHSDSSMCRVHLQGSRSVIQRLLPEPATIRPIDSTSSFLVEEFFTIDVFASTSSFGEAYDHSALGPREEGMIFNDYLQVIHDVTNAERRRLPLDLCDLERRLEEARVCTLRFSHHFGSGTVHLRRDFEKVVHIYHFAGLVYTYQALMEPEAAATRIAPLVDGLFENLRLMPANGAMAQNLAWPLFIAGTESCLQVGRQKWVEMVMIESMQSTGFSSCQQALDFLRLFWAQESGRTRNWISFAKAYGAEGRTFLVY